MKLTIETKYNVGDETYVVFYASGKYAVERAKIKHIYLGLSVDVPLADDEAITIEQDMAMAFDGASFEYEIFRENMVFDCLEEAQRKADELNDDEEEDDK